MCATRPHRLGPAGRPGDAGVQQEQRHATPPIRTGLFVGATCVLALIGASLLVSQLEQLRERKKLLSSLVAFGTRRRTLSLSVLWQTAIPIALGLLLASAVGLTLGAVLLKMTARPVGVDWASVLSMTGIGAAVVLAGDAAQPAAAAAADAAGRSAHRVSHTPRRPRSTRTAGQCAGSFRRRGPRVARRTGLDPESWTRAVRLGPGWLMLCRLLSRQQWDCVVGGPTPATGIHSQCIGLQPGSEANLRVATRSVAGSCPAEPDGVLLTRGAERHDSWSRWSRAMLTRAGSAVRCTA